MVDAKWALTDRDKNVPAWEDEKDKAWQARRMEVYSAMVDCMDRGIGKIIEGLKKTGQLAILWSCFCRITADAPKRSEARAPKSLIQIKMNLANRWVKMSQRLMPGQSLLVTADL